MMKHFRGVLRRFGTFLLSLVLALSSVPAFPLEALAASSLSIGVEGLSATYEGGNWNYVNGVITGTVTTGESSGCTGTTYTPQTGKLILTNTSGSTATLTYVTKKSGDGELVDNANGQIRLDDGQSITISITSANKKDTTSVEISNIKLVLAREVTTTFLAPVNGSYTVDGAAVVADVQLAKSSVEQYELIAKPSNGFKFLRWYRADSGETISTKSTVAYYSTEEQSIVAEFVDENSAVFEVGASLFTDLNDAVLYAQQANESKITLVSDGVLPAGNYTIPSGKTLLIPFDEARTLYTTDPAVTYNQYTTPSPYKTLTMAEGASITVADGGAISLGSKLSSKGQLGGWNGTPTGPDGRIKMDAGSSITVNNGGALYAYGYITGSGSVLAKSGSTVYECFQIKDWRGGSATSGIYDYAFILSQYYVQNIEVPLTLEAGATEYGYSAVNASGSAYPMAASFIGNGGLFNMTKGSVTKAYDSASDRLIIDLDGVAQINSMTMSGLPIIGSISTLEYDLPINSNITINCLQGTNITVNQNIKMLPGAEFNIAQGASAAIASGKKVYAYDNDDWKNFTGSARMYAIGYSASNGTKAIRTASGLTDAKINVDGTLTVNGGLYTSTGGADITSTGTGSVTFASNAPTADATIYEMANNSTKTAVTMKPAQLHNGDDSYTDTAGSPADTEFYYCTTCVPDGVWEKEHTAALVNVTFNANAPVGTTASGSMDTQQVASGVATALNANQFDIDHYHFTGWNSEADGTGTPYTDKQEVTLTEDTTLYAQWEKNTYTVTWKDADGTVIETDENVAFGVTPTYDGETPTKDADTQYTYTFSGWTPEVAAVSGDATYTATYLQAARNYTIKFVDEDGADLQSVEVAYGETPAYTGETPIKDATPEYTYTFDGWTPEITPVKGDATYKAKYAEAKRSYTVIWKNDDDSVIDTTAVEYGTVPTHDDAVKPADAQYTYTFAGWSPELTAVAGDAEYTATFSKVINNYTITFVNEDGTVLQSDLVSYGETPKYNGETPVKAGDAQYSYVFSGWDSSIVPVTGEATYTAKYTTTTNEYRVVFVNENGDVLQSTPVPYGEMPAYIGETPTKDADAQYTYTFKGWNPEIASVTESATYTAEFSKTLNEYTITFVNENGDVLQSSKVPYGQVPTFEGNAPTKDADAQYTYTFAGWSDGTSTLANLPAVSGEATYKATFTGALKSYEVKFDANTGSGEMNSQKLGYGVAGVLDPNVFTKEGSAFNGWNTKADGSGKSYEDKGSITITSDMTLYAQWVLDGWQTAENGDLTYYVKGELQKSGWTEIDGKTYHLDSKTGIAAAGGIYWLERPNEGYAASQWDIDNNDDYETLEYLDNSYFVFGDDGEFQSSASGMYDVAAGTKVVGGNASSPSDELVVWADRGEIPWHAGLVTWQGYHYYFTTGAFEAGKSFVTNTNYYVSKPNEVAWPKEWGAGTFERGKYTFDASGHMLLRDGFVDVGEDTLYYVKGALVYAGLIDVNGDYYYVKSDCKLVKGRDYYVSKTNDLMAAGTYTFDADGKMIRPEDLQQGLVWKDDELYYYVDGEPSYAGLVEVDGYYYYFPGSKVAVRGRDYTITKTNDLKPQAKYTFDDEGRMVTLDGIVKGDDGTWTYYVNGAKTYAGLIQIGDAFYYVKTDCTVVHGQDYYVSKTNGLKAAGKYTFDSEGKMVDLNGIVKDGDTWTYYVDGAKTYAGLIEIEGAYYYVKSDCTVVHGRDYFVSKTNGIVSNGTYTFDTEGKMRQ